MTIALIPDVVWAAIIASLLTVLGVFLTNRGSSHRLLKELLHDSEQRDRERNMDLRREIYLKAAEALTVNHMVLMKLSDLSTSYSELSNQFSKTTASISKVNIIGSNKTVEAVTTLSSIIGKKFLELSAQRYPLMLRLEKIKVQNGLHDQSAKERGRMVEIMKEHNMQGSTDKNLWETINQNFEFEKNRCEEYLDKISKLQEQNGQEQMQLTLACLQALKETGEYFTPALCAVREEMDIPFDIEAYKEIIEKSWQESEQSINDFIEYAFPQNG